MELKTDGKIEPGSNLIKSVAEKTDFSNTLILTLIFERHTSTELYNDPWRNYIAFPNHSTAEDVVSNLRIFADLIEAKCIEALKDKP